MTRSIGTTRRARRGMVREWRLHALSVFSLAVAFVCLGAALLVVTNLRAVEERWAHAGRASVYLKDGATPGRRRRASRRRSRSVPGVTGVHYVSSGDARAEFGQRELDGQRRARGAPGRSVPRVDRDRRARPTCPTPTSPTWSRRCSSSPRSTTSRRTSRGPSASRASCAAASRRRRCSRSSSSRRCSPSSARRCASRSSAGAPRSRCSSSSARPTAS